jgi:hypothetical protein
MAASEASRAVVISAGVGPRANRRAASVASE